MNVNISDKIVVVTGGSRGIGKEVVKTFTELGAYVYFTYLSNEEAAKELEASSLSKGLKVKAEKVNNCSLEQVNLFVKKVINEQKRIDILVNNAGVVRDGLLIRMKDEDWDRV
ncbi:MAG: SDR family NAD(P)-dependent oxidoreductase, partial [Endomicrobium sp.]|nr:SDR family NAD(P)-dependent oxidoreductase [Endomicrobium sp.]